jgi:hypothetical protein
MLDALELAFSRFNGNSVAPIGTYFNARTFAYFQQASDGTLPQAGTWMFVSTSATMTAAQLATAINGVLGSSYTASNFHSYSAGSDAIPYPGQMSDDA